MADEDAAKVIHKRIRHFFSYTGRMKVGGYTTQTDFSKLGTALLVGACVILAVRTARWPRRGLSSTASDRELEAEVEHAIAVSQRLLAALVGSVVLAWG